MLTKYTRSRRIVKRFGTREAAGFRDVPLLLQQNVARTARFAETPYRLPCSSVKNASYGICGVNKSGEALLCQDSPWSCPYQVPPTCNTGAHRDADEPLQLPLID